MNDGCQTVLADSSQDAVILVAVLTSMPRDEDQLKVITELQRVVLKPGGYLYINDFLLNRDERNLQRMDAMAYSSYQMAGYKDIMTEIG